MTPRRPTWPISAAAVLASLIAAGSLRSLLQGDAWWGTAAILSIAAVAAAATVRSFVRVRLIAPLAGSIVAVYLTLLLFVPGTLEWGLPTDRTVQELVAVLRSAFEQIYLDTPPATATPGIRIVVALGVGLVAVLVDALVAGARLPWLAGLPLLLVAIVPGRAVRIGDDLVGVTLTALAFLLLVWLDRRRDRERQPASTAAGLAAAAVAGALLVQTFIPTLTGPSAASASTLRPVFAPGADPLVRLGDHLRRGADVVVLTYRTTATTPLYLRVVTIDDLSGEDWEPSLSGRDTADERPVADFPDPMGLTPEVESRSVETTVSDAGVLRSWLPVPYPATSIDGLPDGWAWEPESLTVAANREVRPADSYTVRSLQVEPTEQQLRSAPAVGGPDFQRYLTLPELAPIFTETAREITAAAVTDYDRALALQDWLRSPIFSYDEDTPELNDGDGDSFDVLASFLDEKTGYCVHFASAMAVMSRTLGIPARIAVGYQPGDRRIQEAGVFEVTSHDLHAWPELFFEGAGWVRFEPTPGRGDVPRWRAGDGNDAGPATPVPTSSATAAGERPDSERDVAAGAAGSSGGPTLGNGLLLLGLGTLLLAPGTVRVLRRRRRLSALAAGRGSPAWDEVHDTAVDLRLIGRAEVTPRALASAISAIVGGTTADLAELDRIVAGVERERFARPGTPGEPLEEAPVRRILTRMRAFAGTPARVRAAFAPRSLLAMRGARGKLAGSRLA
ncbi:MAG: transglutaminase protein [Naasia sp.]|nr:transglutaminase protein [Naasia sp.]